MELGTGAYTYEVLEDWATLPDGWSFREVAAVGADAHDNAPPAQVGVPDLCK